MKKILRYLMGSKGASPSPEQRLVSAHELALKAVLRRRSGEKEKGDSEVPPPLELPATAEQRVSATRTATGPDGGEAPPPRSKRERRAERKQRRRHGSRVVEQASEAGEQKAPPAGEAPPLRTRKQRHSERKQRRLRRSLIADQDNSVSDGMMGLGR